LSIERIPFHLIFTIGWGFSGRNDATSYDEKKKRAAGLPVTKAPLARLQYLAFAKPAGFADRNIPVNS
jgi:hypothetical protein